MLFIILFHINTNYYFYFYFLLSLCIFLNSDLIAVINFNNINLLIRIYNFGVFQAN